jgi:hypothetical protein
MWRRHLAWRTVSLVLGCAALLAQPVPAADLAIRMQQVVSRFVVQTGQSVLGIGSWISGRSFNPATSDFDMRLVITQRGPELQHLQQWRQAKARLVQLIEQEFGTEAPSILRRANLYAPNQLMTGIENAADAVERFRQLNTVPRLSHATRVIPGETPVSLMEGLYGEGARVNLQTYERAAGRVFYYNNGKCVTGLSELVHLGEESGTYTAAGTANTAGQWAEHCLAEIKAGRGDKVAKYLERLERDLFKCRSMSQLPADPALREEIWRMRTALRENPARLFDYSERIARVVARGQTEAAILRSYANAGTLRRAYLRVMLDGVAAQNAVGTQMDRIRQFASGWADIKSAFDALTFVLGTRATAQALGRGDALESLSTSASYLKWIDAFGPLVLTEITTEVLREAERSGYAMAAGSQGSWNLMSGIYTAWGRAGVDPDPRRKLTLADLVARFQYERNLEAFVMAQAIRASTRDLGSATAAADKGVAQSIFDQCWPAIRDAWRWERDTLASEYLTLAEPIAMTPLLIHYKPAEVQAGAQVAFEASSAEGKLGERLARMREIMRILYGPGSGVASNFYWTPSGEGAAETDWLRTMSFAEPVTHPVTVRLDVAPFTSHSEPDKRLLERREASAVVEVVVEGARKPAIAKPEVRKPADDADYDPCPIVGEWDWVDGQQLVISADGRLEVWKGASRINTATWTSTAPCQYVFRHVSGGWVDTVSLGRDYGGWVLMGTNNLGVRVQGRRRYK